MRSIFSEPGDNLVLGRKIAEGGQSEIYEFRIKAERVESVQKRIFFTGLAIAMERPWILVSCMGWNFVGRWSV